MDVDVLEQAKDVWFDKIIQIVNNITIPDVTDGKNYLHDNTFALTGVPEDTIFMADPFNNAVIFTCKKITAKFRSGHFRYKVLPLVVSKGHVVVDLNSIGI